MNTLRNQSVGILAWLPPVSATLATGTGEVTKSETESRRAGTAAAGALQPPRKAVYYDHISPQHGPPATCGFVVPIVSLREPHTMIRAGSFENNVGLLHAPAVGRASMTAVRPVKRRADARLFVYRVGKRSLGVVGYDVEWLVGVSEWVQACNASVRVG